MVERAAAAGADCVKFQKTSLADKFTGAVLDSPYDGEHSWGKTYGEHKVVVTTETMYSSKIETTGCPNKKKPIK